MKKYTIALCALIMTTGFDIQSGGAGNPKRKTISFHPETKGGDSPASLPYKDKVNDKKGFQNAVAQQEEDRESEWDKNKSFGKPPQSTAQNVPPIIKKHSGKPVTTTPSLQALNDDEIKALSKILETGQALLTPMVNDWLSKSLTPTLESIIQKLRTDMIADITLKGLRSKLLSKTVAENIAAIPEEMLEWEGIFRGDEKIDEKLNISDPYNDAMTVSLKNAIYDFNNTNEIKYKNIEKLFKKKSHPLLPGIFTGTYNIIQHIYHAIEAHDPLSNNLNMLNDNIDLLQKNYAQLRESKNGDDLKKGLPVFFDTINTIWHHITPLIDTTKELSDKNSIAH